MDSASSPFADMAALGNNEYYKPGGLFDEFMRLQPAQLSWGGIVSVLGSLIQSHGSCLAKLNRLEEAMYEMKATSTVGGMVNSTGPRGGAPSPTQGGAGDVGSVKQEVDDLFDVLQMDRAEMRRSLRQADAEGPSSHSRVKFLHSLPAFSTLIEDIRDVLVPLGEQSAGGTTAPSPPVPSATHAAPPPPQARPPPMAGTTPPQAPLSGGDAGHHHHHPQQQQPPSWNGAPPGDGGGGRPMIGLEIVDAVANSSDPLSSRGVRVFWVRPDGPAAAAGLRNGDCIVSLNNRPVASRADLKALMASCVPDDIVRVDVLRENVQEPFVVHIKLGHAPPGGPQPAVKPPSQPQQQPQQQQQQQQQQPAYNTWNR